MIKYKNIVINFIIMLCFFISLTLAPSFYSSAANDYSITVPYSEPAKGENCGYLNVLRQMPTGEIDILTYFWNVSGERSGSLSIGVSNGTLTFTAYPLTGSTGKDIFISVGYFSGGKIGYLATLSSKSETLATLTDTFSGNYLGHQAYGAIHSCTLSSGLSNNKFSVIYNNDPTQSYLQQITLIGYSLQQFDQTKINKLTDIYNMSVSIDSKLSQVLQILSDSSGSQQMQDFKDSASDKKGQINSAVAESNNYDKPDGDAIAPSADAYISTDSVSGYNNVLGVITNNSLVITMLLTVCSIALLGYVLFGKR